MHPSQIIKRAAMRRSSSIQDGKKEDLGRRVSGSVAPSPDPLGWYAGWAYIQPGGPVPNPNS